MQVEGILIDLMDEGPVRRDVAFAALLIAFGELVVVAPCQQRLAFCEELVYGAL